MSEWELPKERPDNMTEEEWLQVLAATEEVGGVEVGFRMGGGDRRRELLGEGDESRVQDEEDECEEYEEHLGKDFRVGGAKGGRRGKRNKAAKAGGRRAISWSEHATESELSKVKDQLACFSVTLATFSHEQEAMSAMQSVRETSRGHPQMTPEDARSMISVGLGWLAGLRGGAPPDVVLVPDSSALYTLAVGRGFVHFGEKVISQMADDCTSGYPVERSALEARVRDKEGFLMWFVIHEFTHLLPRMDKHSTEFVSRVSATASSVPWFFASPPFK